MKINSAEFLISNSDPRKCPPPIYPEYAFTGRSNVGKSSLINYLTGRKNLAKTSGKPGKTQLINHFVIDSKWYLADLPGYGFAKASKKQREQWDQFIQQYLRTRENLMCVLVLIDSRHAPQPNDLEFMAWLGKKQLPFVMVFTKTDKLKSNELRKNLEVYQEEMLKEWGALPESFSVSAFAKTGGDAILDFIADTNQLFVGPT